MPTPLIDTTASTNSEQNRSPGDRFCSEFAGGVVGGVVGGLVGGVPT